MTSRAGCRAPKLLAALLRDQADMVCARASRRVGSLSSQHAAWSAARP